MDRTGFCNISRASAACGNNKGAVRTPPAPSCWGAGTGESSALTAAGAASPPCQDQVSGAAFPDAADPTNVFFLQHRASKSRPLLQECGRADTPPSAVSLTTAKQRWSPGPETNPPAVDRAHHDVASALVQTVVGQLLVGAPPVEDAGAGQVHEVVHCGEEEDVSAWVGTGARTRVRRFPHLSAGTGAPPPAGPGGPTPARLRGRPAPCRSAASAPAPRPGTESRC